MGHVSRSRCPTHQPNDCEKTNMTTITRSAGIAVPGTGFVAGGGMTGATQELDAAIQAAAEALRRQYPRDVSIRFNSDRKSGGAWLVTHPVDTFGTNTEIGICAGYYPVDTVVAEDLFIAGAYRALDALPRHVVMSAFIGNKSLRSTAIANAQTDDPQRCYCWNLVPSIEAGIAYLAEHAILHGKYE